MRSMESKKITKLKNDFEAHAQNHDGIEFWFARDLQKLLLYEEWRNFFNVVEKAKVACKTSGQQIEDHFVELNKMVQLGSTATREIDDIMLTRYACYLVAQNGDPRKDQIAFAQSYFAVQTRKQELIEQRVALIERISARHQLSASEAELSKLIYQRGVGDAGFARIRSRGDEALFGFTTAIMKKRFRIPKGRPLADFLPTITLTAKNLATEMTNFNVQKNNLKGEQKISSEHVRNNNDIRKLLGKRGIQPERLPSEEDLRKIRRKIKEDEKAIAQSKVRRKVKKG